MKSEFEKAVLIELVKRDMSIKELSEASSYSESAIRKTIKGGNYPRVVKEIKTILQIN